MTKTTRSERDAGWVHISDVQAGLGDFLEDMTHGARLDIDLPYGTLRVERYGASYETILLGSGGGFCWSREWKRQQIQRYVSNTVADPMVRKHE